MDWKKTKNILVIVLIFMNIFLIYNIYYKDTNVSGDVNFSKVKDILIQRDIDVSQIEYKSYVKIKKYYVKEINKTNSELSILTDNGFEISNEDGNLNIFYDLNNNSAKVDDVINDVFELLEIGEQNSTLVYDVEKDGKKIIKYNQLSDNNIFEDGFIQIEYIIDQNILFKYQWLEIVDTGEFFDGSIYPMEKSILMLIDMIDFKTKIISYEIVYSIDEDSNAILDNVIIGEPIPYWEAVTEQGETILLNGLR